MTRVLRGTKTARVSWWCSKCDVIIMRSNRTRHVRSKSCAWVTFLRAATARGLVLFDKSGEVEHQFFRLGFAREREPTTGVTFFEKRVQTIWDALTLGTDSLSPRGVVLALGQFDTREEFEAAWTLGWRGREYAAKRRSISGQTVTRFVVDGAWGDVIKAGP